MREVTILFGLAFLVMWFGLDVATGVDIGAPVCAAIGFLVIADGKGVFLKGDWYAVVAGLLGLVTALIAFFFDLWLGLEGLERALVMIFGISNWVIFALIERKWPSIARPRRQISD